MPYVVMDAAFYTIENISELVSNHLGEPGTGYGK
jgi:transposase